MDAIKIAPYIISFGIFGLIKNINPITPEQKGALIVSIFLCFLGVYLMSPIKQKK